MIFARVSSLIGGRLNAAALIFSIASGRKGPRFLPRRFAADFSTHPGGIGLPSFAARILARASGVWRFPVFAAASFARVSGDFTRPMLVSRTFSICSGDNFRPRNAAETFARTSAVLGMPTRRRAGSAIFARATTEKSVRGFPLAVML
jgi:hypothetical protein